MWLRNFVFTLATLTLTIVSWSPVHAQLMKDSFDNNIMTPGFWQVTTSGDGPSVSEENHQVVVSFPRVCAGPQFWAGYSGLWFVRGDFDVQVDFHLLDWPQTNGVRVGMYVYGADGTAMSMQRTSLGPDEQLGAPRENYTVDFDNGNYFRDATTDTEGALRITRSGSTITGYYWNAGSASWHALGSYPLSDAYAYIHLQSWSDSGSFNGDRVRIGYDNFQYNRGNVTFPDGTTFMATAARSVEGGGNVLGKVSISSLAPADGFRVTVKNTNPAAIAPTSVTIPAGAHAAMFQIGTDPVASLENGSVSAVLGSVTFDWPLTIMP